MEFSNRISKGKRFGELGQGNAAIAATPHPSRLTASHLPLKGKPWGAARQAAVYRFAELFR